MHLSRIGSVEVEAAVAPTAAPTTGPSTDPSATVAPTPVAAELPDTAAFDSGPLLPGLVALLALSAGIGINAAHRRSRRGA